MLRIKLFELIQNKLSEFDYDSISETELCDWLEAYAEEYIAWPAQWGKIKVANQKQKTEAHRTKKGEPWHIVPKLKRAIKKLRRLVSKKEIKDGIDS